MGFLNNIKALWIIIIVLVVLNIGSIGSIWLTREPRPVFPRRGLVQDVPRRGGGDFLKRHLNFSEAQAARFDSLQQEHREALEMKADEIRTLREELMGKMQNQEFSEDAEALVMEIGEKQSELELLNYRHFRQVMSICDEEQQELFLQTIRQAVGPHRYRGDWRGTDDDRGRGLRREERREGRRGPGR